MSRCSIALAAAICSAACHGAGADDATVLSESFELRYVTDLPRASGPTDFKGETEIFTTDDRVTFLQHYADYAKRYFNDSELDRDVVPMAVARERLAAIKEQPLPSVRRRLPLTTWRWLGYREGENERRAASIDSWIRDGGRVDNGALHLTGPFARMDRTIPTQSWRFSLEWRSQWPENGRVLLSLNDAVTVAVDEGRLSYSSEGNAVDVGPCAAGAWHWFKLEVDLEEQRYNLIADGVTVADFVPLASPQIAAVNAFSFAGSEGVRLDDLWGVGYERTAEPRLPFTIRTFLDEAFEPMPDPTGWSDSMYDDSAWQLAQTPVIHGGERHAGEDLYLRTRVDVGGFKRAMLIVEGIAPEADLFVNGRHVTHIDSPVPLRVDVAQYLQTDATNTVALRVSHSVETEPYSAHCPSDVNVGWYAGRMWLDLTSPAFVDEILVHAESLGNPAYLQPHVRLRNDGSGTFSGTLALEATRWFPVEAGAPSGAIEVPVEIPEGGTVTVEHVLPVTDPELWSPDHPNLYTFSATLMNGAREAVDDNVVTTGIRTVGQGGGTFRINGQPELSTGALLLGYRPPLDQIVVTRACSSDEWIVRELMQIQHMGANTARTGFLLGENPRFAEIGDQLGVMFIWSTPAGRWWGDPLAVDFENYPSYMRQVYNHPSIMMWEVTNEPSIDNYDQLNTFYSKAYDTLYPVDPSRLICLITNKKYSKYSGNDAGAIDVEGNPNPYPHVPAWMARMVTRAHHVHITGYGALWTALRDWPGLEADFLNSTDRAYFNTENEESIGQPNWSLDRGKPWYKVHSYEWEYDEGSIGRKLASDEWQTSQAWQAFSAYESMRRQRMLDIDGFSWCSLHGGANSGTYQKPLMDFYGRAKLAYWAVKMLNQDVLAGSADVDVVYGPGDDILPIVMNLGESRLVTVMIEVKNMAEEVVAATQYDRVSLAAGRTVTKLAPWRPDLPAREHYAVEYAVTAVGGGQVGLNP